VSPDGEAALARLAQIIAQAFMESLPPGTDLPLDTQGGDGCPARGVADIVDAFLFRRAPTPAKKKGRKKAGKRASGLGPACEKPSVTRARRLDEFWSVLGVDAG
jgi:hypothetical protein